MKFKFLSRVFAASVWTFVFGAFALDASAAGRVVHSGDGIKVINNFNYGQPQAWVARPAYVQRAVSPEYVVPVAVDAQEVQPSVIYSQPQAPWYRDWYAALKYVHTLTSFTSKHYTDGVYCVGGQYCEDKYSFETMMGFSASVGKSYGDNWRFELEGGYTGEYSDSVDDVEFSISAPYMGFNALYNFSGATNDGFYLGAGLGAAWTKTGVSAGGTEVFFLHNGETKREFSPMIALSAGYQMLLTDRLAFDIAYKLWTFGGTDHDRDFQTCILCDGSDDETHTFTNKTGWLINNSLSLGLRWYF
jgi:hypothetical protein